MNVFLQYMGVLACISIIMGGVFGVACMSAHISSLNRRVKRLEEKPETWPTHFDVHQQLRRLKQEMIKGGKEFD